VTVTNAQLYGCQPIGMPERAPNLSWLDLRIEPAPRRSWEDAHHDEQLRRGEALEQFRRQQQSKRRWRRIALVSLVIAGAAVVAMVIVLVLR
jgi:hypothetical protein